MKKGDFTLTVKNQVQLITYPDALGGNLKNLNSVLSQYFLDVFDGGVHIVSPFKSSGDKEADTFSCFEIEPEFGTWEDIKTIGRKFDVLIDIMPNCIFYQSDINKFKKLFIDFFHEFSKNNVKIIRLNIDEDIIDKLRESRYFDDTEIYKYIDWIKKTANSFGIELLTEVHVHYSIQYKLTEHGYWIYDFSLPYTILDAFINKSNEKLYKYLDNRPQNQFTLLDCKDGIHVNQIGCLYYSPLNFDDDAYLAARAIQFFVPGIPQVYSSSLLKDKDVKKSDEDVKVSRKIFSRKEIETSLQKKWCKEF